LLLFFHSKGYVFDNKWFGQHFGRFFFADSSGHPARKQSSEADTEKTTGADFSPVFKNPPTQKSKNVKNCLFSFLSS
jgi:hypothetical protein